MNRKLGSSEYVTWLSDQVGSLNFVTVAHLSGAVDEHIVQKALDVLCQCHPLLKTRIEVKENHPVLVSDNVLTIPLRTEPRRGDDHWITETEKEMNNQFLWSKGPLVRVVLLKGAETSDILVTFNHIISEASSGIYFVHHLLTYVAMITRKDTPPLNVLPERPPVEELLPPVARNIRGLVKTGALISKQVASILVQHPQKLPKDGDLFAENRCAHFIHHTLSPEETETLIKECRHHATTVHGAVCAAVLKAAAAQVSPSDDKPVTLGCMSAVDLRPFLDPPIGEEIGFFASMVITAHRIGNNSFWDVAQDVKNAVHQSIKKGEHFVFISLLDKLIKNTNPDDFMKRALQLYPAALLMTNVGQLDIPDQYGPIRLEGLHFTLANIAASEHFNTAVATYKDKLVMNFSYTEPTMSSTRAHVLVDTAVTMLKSVISGR